MGTSPPPPPPPSSPRPAGGAAPRSSRDDKMRAARRDLQEVLEHTTSPAPVVELLRAAPLRDAAGGGWDGDGGDGLEGYRCKCTLQLVPRSVFDGAPDAGGEDGGACLANAEHRDRGRDALVYVERLGGGRLRPLPGGVFPPANARIRRAMRDLLHYLNARAGDRNASADGEGAADDAADATAVLALREHLTSATFVTSWGDAVRAVDSDSAADGASLGGGGDCLVTLHYGPPGLRRAACSSGDARGDDSDRGRRWQEEAQLLCDRGGFAMVTGRSKGVRIAATAGGRDRDAPKGNHHRWREEEGVVRDDLWLTLVEAPGDDDGEGTAGTRGIERVALAPPPPRDATATPARGGTRRHHVRTRINVAPSCSYKPS